ncbi:MAG TPA: cupin-like domain-containing protein [Pyrinomonadaceae bacterium]|nr:cupin-like domain-containing protein [Pyrinomonadaceae bacterium]
MERAKAQLIDRVSSETFEKKYLEQNRPAIITDALSDWDAIGKWSPDYLASALKSKQVTVAISSEAQFNYDPNRGAGEEAARYRYAQMDFVKAVSAICRDESGHEHYYLMQRSVPDEFPELLPDIKTPAWLAYQRPAINLWFGSTENVTPLHYDHTNNFFAQVYGRKRLTLFDPMQTDLLYPYPLESSASHVSFINLQQPDFGKYPKFRQARALTSLIEPGELLYLPAYWWHHVRSLQVSISINFWWPPGFEQNFLPNALRTLPLLYQKDHLQSVKAEVLSEVGLEFIDAASLLQSKGHRWAAILLAGAALEDWVRDFCQRHGLAEKEGEAARPLSLVNSSLLQKRLYSEETALKISAWDKIITRVLDASNERFSDDEVDSVIKGIHSFINDRIGPMV